MKTRTATVRKAWEATTSATKVRGNGAVAAEGRLVTPAFLLVMASTFAYFLAMGALVAVLLRFVEGPLRSGKGGVGIVVGAFSLTALILRPVAGRIGDARGRSVLMVGGGAVVALSVAGYIVAPSVPVLVVFRLLTGVGEAFFFTGAASAANDLAPEERRGEAVSYFSLALYGGIAAGPFLGEAVLGIGFSAVWIAAVAAVAAAALLGSMVRDVEQPEDLAPASRPPGW